MLELFTVYLRREPTTDALTIKMGGKGKLDVVAYRDEGCTKSAARWPWHLSSKPDRRKKKVVINCLPYKAVWLSNPPATN